MTQKKREPVQIQPVTSILSRVNGQEVKEVYILCRPGETGPMDLTHQAAAVYGELGDVLAAEGGTLEDVIQEFLFFRRPKKDGPTFFSQIRNLISDDAGMTSAYHPASTCIEQPPLDEWAQFELSAFAVIPHSRKTVRLRNDRYDPARGHMEDSSPRIRVYLTGSGKQMHGGNIYGVAGNVYEETYTMFREAEELLKQEDMDFRNVVRTWIHFRDIERDYAEFNRGRRAFFGDRHIKLRPASTGIGGAPHLETRNIVLSFYAIGSQELPEFEIMTASTLNEAWQYGSDFSRGLKVVEANKISLSISGTASIDEEGRTVYSGNAEAQIKRMLLNISTLLSAQNASFSDIVQAATYLKNTEDAPVLRRILKEQGLEDIPNALVQAPICRPDLLCEMEALAVLPKK